MEFANGKMAIAISGEFAITIMVLIVISIVTGIILGNGAVYLFNKIPGKWLCDYNEEPTEELLNPTRQRINSVPYKGIFVSMFAAFTLVLLIGQPNMAIPGILAIWLLVEISISDIKYSIVPDQLLVLLAVTALGFIPYYQAACENGICKEAWAGIPRGLGIQVLGGAIAISIMAAIYMLTKLLYKKETLGFGDVKLCTVIGMLVGANGVMLVIAFGFFVAATSFIYGLVKKKVKLEDEKPIGQYFAIGAILYIILVMPSEEIRWLLEIF